MFPASLGSVPHFSILVKDLLHICNNIISRAELGDGAIVAWSGYAAGFEPGAEATFEISIENETDQPWPGCFCLNLMAREQPLVVGTLEQRPFVLEPGVGFSDKITVQFPDSLDAGAYGLSLAGESYAQVITPGYVIKLGVGGQTYRYHGGDNRVVAVPSEEVEPRGGSIAVEEVAVTAPQVVIRGSSTLPDDACVGTSLPCRRDDGAPRSSTLPDDACVGTELWADGVPISWWPADARATVQAGTWELAIALEPAQALQPLPSGRRRSMSALIQVDRVEVLSNAVPEPRALSAFADVSASSHLRSDRYGQYVPYAAVDGSLETSWVEGVSGAGLDRFAIQSS